MTTAEPGAMLVAPSLLSADFSRLGAEIEDVERAGADLLHLDLMDGVFVPNLTFGPLIVEAVAAHCTIPLDAHLMVADPDPLIQPLADAGVARVAVHVEACVHLHRTLSDIRQRGIKAGVAINPATSLSVLDGALPWIDFVLIMAVNPGFGGQQFIPESLDKIRRLRQDLGDRDCAIEVDGGVGPGNARALVSAGASILVAGSAVFGAQNRAAAVAGLRRASQQGEQQ